MAGGNYKIMDKVRPGAYFQRVSDSAAEAGFNPNGILCWVRGLRWGKPIIDIGLDDYSRNDIYKYCGLTNADEKLQIWSQYGRRLILANPLQGGVKARATIREADTGKYVICIPDCSILDSIDMESEVTGISITSSKITAAVDSGNDAVETLSPAPSTMDNLLSVLDAFIRDGAVTTTHPISDDTQVILFKREDGTLVSDADEIAAIKSKLSEKTPSEWLSSLGGTLVVGVGDDISSASQFDVPIEPIGLDAVAAYEGSLGNEISIVIVKKSSLEREVRTTVNGEVVDAQVITDWAAFVDNDWVHLEGERYGLPDESDPINLSGGVDGELSIPERIMSQDIRAMHQYKIDEWSFDTSTLADPTKISAGERVFVLDGDGNRIKGITPAGSHVQGSSGPASAVELVSGTSGLGVTNDSSTFEIYIVRNAGAADLALSVLRSYVAAVYKIDDAYIRYGLADDQSNNYNVDKVLLSGTAGADTDAESGCDVKATLYGETIGATLDDSEVLKIALPASRGGAILELHPYLVDADDDTKLSLLDHDAMFSKDDRYYIVNEPIVFGTSPNLNIPLDGGSHGLPEPYGDLLRELRYQNWSVIVFEDQSPDTCQLAINYVKYLREECGLYRRLVVCLPPAEGDYEHANNPIDWDFVTNQGTTWREDKSLSAYVRACMALCSYNQSNTYEAVPIADAPDQKLTDKEIVRCLTQGYSICTRRDDGIYVIEKDINCFHEYDDEKLYALTKNRVLRTVDYLCIMLRYYWELQFCGKVTNDDIGRSMWKARVQEILDDIQKNKGISDYTDPIVLRGKQLDEVITQIGIWPLDSMEIVYVQIKLNV